MTISSDKAAMIFEVEYRDALLRLLPGCPRCEHRDRLLYEPEWPGAGWAILCDNNDCGLSESDEDLSALVLKWSSSWQK